MTTITIIYAHQILYHQTYLSDHETQRLPQLGYRHHVNHSRLILKNHFVQLNRFSDNHTNNSNQLNVKQRSPTLSRNIRRENIVNNLTLSENSSQLSVQQQPETTNCCTQCNPPEHDALACPNF